jgi:glycosyltransferase involved in cell wall biosynthesis
MERLIAAHLNAGDHNRFSYSVGYVNGEKDDLVPELEELGIEVHLLSAGSLPWPIALRQLVTHGAYDIVHSHSPLVASAVRLATQTIRPAPILFYTEHNSWDPYRRPTRWLNRATYRLDQVQFAVSNAARNSVPTHLRTNLSVLNHGIDVTAVSRRKDERAEARRRMGVAETDIVVGTVANFRPEKNYEGLLRVAEQLTSTAPNVRFVSIGQGPLAEDIHAAHSRHRLGDRFLLMGAQPDAVGLMAGFDVFTLASHVEGLPVAFMEARALGIPVVVTAVGGLPDLITHGIDGLLVQPRSDDALRDALTAITKSSSLRRQLAVASAQRAYDCDASTTTAYIEDRYLAAKALT